LLFIAIIAIAIYFSQGQHPTNHVTMVEPFTVTAAWCGESAHPTLRSLFGRGWPRVVYEGYVKFNNAAKKKVNFY
jgi:hypothetical protein